METGADFRGYIEVIDNFEDAEKAIENALSRLHSGGLRAGKKSTRGYGKIGITSLKKAVFTNVEKWLDFDMFDEECWKTAEKITPALSEKKLDSICVELSQNNSALSIRRYTTEAPNEKERVPNYKTLSLNNGTPLFPERAGRVLSVKDLKNSAAKKRRRICLAILLKTKRTELINQGLFLMKAIFPAARKS